MKIKLKSVLLILQTGTLLIISQTFLAECEPLRCRLGCRNGNQKDDKGCDICACRAFPNEFNPARTGAFRGGPKRGFPKVCPVVQQGVGGICVEGCDYRDNTCPEGQICCSNGCGHVCTEGMITLVYFVTLLYLKSSIICQKVCSRWGIQRK